MTFNITIQLLASAVFFVGGLGAGLVLAKVSNGKVRAVGLVVVGMIVGAFMGYAYVLSQMFTIENRIEPAGQTVPVGTPPARHPGQ